MYEEKTKAESGLEALGDATRQELDWLRDSGMAVESWERIDSQHTPKKHEEGGTHNEV